MSRGQALRAITVGGGVLDAPQVDSLSRVICRAASPLAAVPACGSGRVPGRDESLPYKRPESSPQWNVGGGVPDAPQVSSPSRVMRRAASPLAAVPACGSGEVCGRDESLPYKSTAKRSTAVSRGPGMPGPYKRPEGLPQRNVGGGVPDAPQVSSPSRVICRAASPLAAVPFAAAERYPRGMNSSPTNQPQKGLRR